MPLTAAQFRQIVDLCAPHMQTVAARNSCFSLAFSNAPFRNQINWEGATTDYLTHLLRTLLNIHRYNGEHPLRTLLVSLKTQYGTDVQAQIDALLPQIDALPEGVTLPDLPLTLFLSYARADDEPFVRRLYDDLKAHGFNVWYDRVRMPNRGVGFTQEIAHTIEQADRLILVCGPAAYDSEYVRKEYEHALIHCKPISPAVRLGDFPPPILDQLSANPLDTLDLRDDSTYGETFAYLLRQVRDQPLPLAPLTNVRVPEQWYITRSVPQRQVIQSLTALGRENTVAISAINGLGGVGKSVLAAMVAHDCEIRRTFPDGIVLIEVGKQPNLTELQARLGKLVGLEAAEFKENLDANRQLLSAAFLGKRMLIILDNVWNKHAVDAANFSAEGVKFIVTTRLVNLANTLGRSVRVDLLLPEEGADLIMRRADLKEAQRPACEDISRALNGLTLAVSIAAAKIKNDALTPEAYLARLKNAENPLTELTLADPDDPYADANQPEQNFAASLNLTYGDLNAEMQRRFRLLGVFAPEGTFDAAAAAAVWEEPLEAAEKKLNLLVSLELAARDEGGRYSQHSLLRAYAHALLREADALEAAAARHFEYYLTRHDYGSSLELNQHYAEITPDFDNLRAALLWGFDHEVDRACSFVTTLDNGYMSFHQPYPVRRELLDKAQNAGGQSTLNQAHTLRALGDLERLEANYGGARERYSAALRLYEAIPDRLGQANTLQGLGELECSEGNYLLARQRYAEALALARRIPDLTCQLNSLSGLARLEKTLGNIEAACQQYAELFALTDSIPAFANHPVVQGWKREAAALCGGEASPQDVQPSPEDMARLQQLAHLLIAWVQTPDWSASRAYLEVHQADILTDQAEQAMERLVQVSNNHPDLVRHLELLRSARREGIAAAYEQMRSGQGEGLQRLVDIINTLLQAEDEAAMVQCIANTPSELLDQAVQLAEQILPQYPPEVQAVFRGRLADLRWLRGGS